MQSDCRQVHHPKGVQVTGRWNIPTAFGVDFIRVQANRIALDVIVLRE